MQARRKLLYTGTAKHVGMPLGAGKSKGCTEHDLHVNHAIARGSWGMPPGKFILHSVIMNLNVFSS